MEFVSYQYQFDLNEKYLFLTNQAAYCGKVVSFSDCEIILEDGGVIDHQGNNLLHFLNNIPEENIKPISGRFAINRYTVTMNSKTFIKTTLKVVK